VITLNKPKRPISGLIAMLYRQELKYVSHLLEKCDISFSQLPFVTCLYKNPGITQEALSRKVEVDKAMCSRVLKQLEQKGLVARKISPQDARAKLIYPTDQLIAKKRELLSIIKEWNDILTQGLTNEEIETVKLVNQKMIENVQRKFVQ